MRRFDLLERDVVVVHGDDAEQEHPGAADSLAGAYERETVRAQAGRSGHPQPWAHLVVDPGCCRDRGPHGRLIGLKERAGDDGPADLPYSWSPGRMNMTSGTTQAGDTLKRKRTDSAMSSGLIISSGATCSLTKSVIGVSTKAGQSAVDLMP